VRLGPGVLLRPLSGSGYDPCQVYPPDLYISQVRRKAAALQACLKADFRTCSKVVVNERPDGTERAAGAFRAKQLSDI